MPKFKRIVKEIEAHQFLGKTVPGICVNPKCFINLDSNSPHVHTIHNNQPVQIETGDWILPEPNGVNFYPCKDTIFKETYEEIMSDKNTETEETEEIEQAKKQAEDAWKRADEAIENADKLGEEEEEGTD